MKLLNSVILILVLVSVSSAQTLAIGSNTVQSVADSNTQGSAEAFPYKAVASGTVNSVIVYVDSPSTATKLIVGYYTNSNSAPKTLLTQGSLLAPKQGWQSVVLNPVNLVSGTKYWVALLGTGGALAFRDSNCASSVSSRSSSLTSLPATWSSGKTWNSCKVSAYSNIASAHHVSLQWDSNSQGSFNIYRSTSSIGPFTKIDNVATLVYTDTSVSSGQTYYYTVSQVFNNQESAMSNQVEATVP